MRKSDGYNTPIILQIIQMTDTSQFSRALSYLLHPLIIPTFAISVLLVRTDLYPIILPLGLKLWYIAVVFCFTWLIPVVSVYILLKTKAISSIEMQSKAERTIPLLVTSASYMAFLYFIRPTNIPPVFLYIIYAATFALLTGLLINVFYKISLHTLGWGAYTATLVSISLRMGLPLVNLLCISVMLSGLAGYARLRENAHNQTQVYVGYVTGIAIVMLITLLV